jgi:hypothetical protein
MLSHEPKNYALLRHDGSLILHGVAFHSSRAEPFGEAFLQEAITNLLVGNVAGVREAYLTALDRLRRRKLPTRDVSSLVRLTKSPAAYFAVRDRRRELPYEAMLASGRTAWSVGDRVRIYRKRNGGFGLLEQSDNDPVGTSSVDFVDYDVDHYSCQLRQTFASRLARAFTPADYESVFAPDQWRSPRQQLQRYARSSKRNHRRWPVLCNVFGRINASAIPRRTPGATAGLIQN